MTNLAKILSAFIIQSMNINIDPLDHFKYESAIIENLYIGNAIKDAKTLNEDLHAIGGPFGSKQLSPAEAFIYLNKIFTKANAFTEEKFDKENIKKLLTTEISEEYFTEEDLQDLILFIRQKINLEITSIDDIYRAKYIKNLKTLGLANEILPQHFKYDYIWILGSTRSMMQNRMKYFKNLLDEKKLSDTSIVIFLAGNREIYLEIDSMSDATSEENKEYFMTVAKKNNILFDTEKPFIKYTENIPSGREKDRTYLNTINEKLTETMIGEDIYERVFGKKCKNISDEINMSEPRPTTKTTAIYTMKMMLNPNFQEKPKNKPVDILLVSNNFYILRQLRDVKNVIRELFTSSENDINNFSYEDFNFTATGSSYEFNEEDLIDINYEMIKLAIGQYKSLTHGQMRKRAFNKLAIQQ